MPVQPDQDTRVPTGENPLPGEVERERADIRVVSVLGAIALLVAVGMWFYTKDREMVAGDGTTVKATTGAGSQELPLPNTPRLPPQTPPHQ